MSDPVTYERDGRVAVITVDNPPVNALGQAVRAGLIHAVARLEQDAQANAALLLGAGKLFLGGADITEFGQPPRAPHLGDVVDTIEAARKPVICAIHGAALGGGLEIALGCHYRLVMPGTRLGLPEVTLGIIPGAGGTQRLPRLIGVSAALDIIPAGGSVDADIALDLGLADRMGTKDWRADGLAFARDILGQGAGPRPVGAMPSPAPDAAALERARTHWAGKAPNEVARLAAIDAVAASAEMPLRDGLAEERRIFETMLQTPQRAALVHAFFSERKVAKVPEASSGTPRAVTQIGLVGGGTMGAGIATSALLSGLRVTLSERDQQAAARAYETVLTNLNGAVQRGKLTAERRDALIADAFKTTVGHDALSDADLIIEAVFEDMAVKQDVFRALDAVAKPGAVLATNTSYLDVAQIAAVTARPDDVIGLHFFSPAHVMKLVEVVVPDSACADAVATGFAVARRMGKIAVRAGVCDGFIGNRIMSAYRACADRLVLAGASPYDVDRAVRAFGWPMGPHEMADLAGLDISFAARQRRAQTRDPRDIVPTWADALCHAGRLGRKTGRGYYLYPDGARSGIPDPELAPLIDAARRDAGVTPRHIPDDEIRRRYMAALVNEAARVLQDGIALRPLDIDMVFLHGYGFPRWRGGPMHWADAQGLSALLADIERYAVDDPYFWQPATLLRDLVAQGKPLSSLNVDKV